MWFDSFDNAAFLTVVSVFLVTGISGESTAYDHAYFTFFMRWLHVLSGVMWIGLLWYFNFVQIPIVTNKKTEKEIVGEKKKISAYELSITCYLCRVLVPLLYHPQTLCSGSYRGKI